MLLVDGEDNTTGGGDGVEQQQLLNNVRLQSGDK